MNVLRGLYVGLGSLTMALSVAYAAGCSSSSSGPADGGGSPGEDAGGSSSGGSSSGASSSGSSSGASSSGSSSGAGSSSSSSGGTSSGGSSSGAMEGGTSSSSSGGGGCDAGVYSFDMATANSCIASYAPHMPSGFTAGHCPSNTDGCCFKQGPCGFTSNCNYNISAIVAQAMTQCTNGGGTWQASPP